MAVCNVQITTPENILYDGFSNIFTFAAVGATLILAPVVTLAAVPFRIPIALLLMSLHCLLCRSSLTISAAITLK